MITQNEKCLWSVGLTHASVFNIDVVYIGSNDEHGYKSQQMLKLGLMFKTIRIHNKILHMLNF